MYININKLKVAPTYLCRAFWFYPWN